MTDKQKQIVEMIREISSSLTEQETEQEQERLLAFGEGLAFMAQQRTPPAAPQSRSRPVA